jgi:fatty acid-binding protein DegV
MSIRIITDSNYDLPNAIAEKLNIEVMSLPVYLEDKEFLDGVTLKSKELFELFFLNQRYN